MHGDVKSPPVIDFSPYYTRDALRKQRLIREIRQACLDKGFFQLTGHGVPRHLQDAIFEQAADFFALPLDTKMQYDKNLNNYNRGYEHIRAQNFEGKGAGDLNESLYFGRDIPLENTLVKKGKFGCGPNVYPDAVSNSVEFQETIMSYHHAMLKFAQDVLTVLAMTLDLEPSAFDEFGHNAIAILKLLHYPPQSADISRAEDERGIGAHTGFGAITLLLQDTVGGLQVYDTLTSTWIDVLPTPGAYVVNLGKFMKRWTNDRYVSNLHRVINKSGRERYSVPIFFCGNPDYLVSCLPTCLDETGLAKYRPFNVGHWMRERYKDTYGTRYSARDDCHGMS